ncbi:PIN domain-containing protein [Pandoraea sputorum]|uniref:type II toxin-antitoxin system VapC family toxin n=1 Tax=Pandoraea sputorum TaxID=93222 RepID=UPI001241C54B|nr:type II toxin-antitoxin system VapC family toxin [Pandoraea sputorum]
MPAAARKRIADRENTLIFSVAGLWEIGIKGALGCREFQVDPRVLRGGLFHVGYEALSIEAAHTFEVIGLPALHQHPFDRLLMGYVRPQYAVKLRDLSPRVPIADRFRPRS